MFCVFDHNYKPAQNSECFVEKKRKKRWEACSKTPVREKQLQSDMGDTVLCAEESDLEVSEQ